jgi:hypothetical protein
MNKEIAPYIVSADVNRLMLNWARENRYTVPGEGYFQGMLNDLERVLNGYFESVHIVPEKYLSAGMEGMAKRSQLPIISLDRAYVNPRQKNLVGYIDITRTVDENLQSRGLSERPGTPSIDAQLYAITQSLETNRVALLDDVLFEGGTHTTVAEWLKQRGIIVEDVLVGIAIREGAEKIANNGINVRSLLCYDEVVDEICERDFIAGVPMSGRTVVSANGEVSGAPYFSPFGIPEKWASIPPEYAESFSDFCLAQSIMMWSKVEQLSRTNISTAEVPKPVHGLEYNKSISSALRRVNGKR